MLEDMKTAWWLIVGCLACASDGGSTGSGEGGTSTAASTTASSTATTQNGSESSGNPTSGMSTSGATTSTASTGESSEGSSSSGGVPQTVLFAAIGDYGTDDRDEAAVAALVDSWNPEFVITFGDNNYPDGEAE